MSNQNTRDRINRSCIEAGCCFNMKNPKSMSNCILSRNTPIQSFQKRIAE